MGLRYAASFDAVAATAIQDLFEITAPSDAVVVIHSLRLGQSSDAGDAQAEMLPIVLRRGSSATTSGSGGAAVTPAVLESGFAAAGSTVERNNATQMSGGAITDLLADAWNVQVGFLYQPVPEERIVLSPGERLTVSLDAAPADSISISATLTFEELGG